MEPYSSSDGTQDTIDLSGYKHRLLAHVNFFTNQDTLTFLSRTLFTDAVSPSQKATNQSGTTFPWWSHAVCLTSLPHPSHAFTCLQGGSVPWCSQAQRWCLQTQSSLGIRLMLETFTWRCWCLYTELSSIKRIINPETTLFQKTSTASYIFCTIPHLELLFNLDLAIFFLSWRFKSGLVQKNSFEGHKNRMCLALQLVQNKEGPWRVRFMLSVFAFHAQLVQLHTLWAGAALCSASS